MTPGLDPPTGAGTAEPQRFGGAVRVVRVDAASHAYDALVGGSLLPSLDTAFAAAVPGAKRAVLFADSGVPVASVDHAVGSLGRAGLSVHRGPNATFTPSETMKSLTTIERMLGAMAAAGMDRGDVAVVIGGGVLGDLSGFAAATYKRGVRWINLPSTLLAMVDASVGGKTGANLSVETSLRKNLVGAFWQPSLVAADVDLLRTLDERHFRVGLAECIKHGMLAADFGHAGLGSWTSDRLPRILGRDTFTLVELIARNIAVKARVVGADEREEAPDSDGGRALLNLGHTFGHAIETLPGLSPDGVPAHAPLHHGEAVALGLVAAAATAVGLGIAPAQTLEHTQASVRAAGLPVSVSGLPATAELIGLMMHDKKVAQGRLRLVLPTGDGRCRVVADPARGAVEAGWNSIRAG